MSQWYFTATAVTNVVMYALTAVMAFQEGIYRAGVVLDYVLWANVIGAVIGWFLIMLRSCDLWIRRGLVINCATVILFLAAMLVGVPPFGLFPG